jgi:hypothetical protein
VVLGQPREKKVGDPISMEKSWVWWYTPVIPAMEDHGSGQHGKKQDRIFKKAFHPH